MKLILGKSLVIYYLRSVVLRKFGIFLLGYRFGVFGGKLVFLGFDFLLIYYDFLEVI